MKLKDKVAVITGGASGIGKAMAKRFIAEGAKHIVIVDMNAEGVAAVASELGCIGMVADVTDCEAVERVINDTEDNYGPIDLFCSNAGVFVGASPESANSEWELSWGVNVMAHVYAARYLIPRMVKRGGGYFLNTASAAGLLNQIGGAAYGTTKHAAVGFGEWIALMHQHEGIKVSMLCPQAVRTAMTDGDSEAMKAAAGDGMMEPDVLVDSVIEGLEKETFLILPHSGVLEYLQGKTADYDRWISGMSRWLQKLKGLIK